MTDNRDSVETRIIKTQDENGELYSFELIDVIEYNGREYGLLIHVNEEEPKESSAEDEEEEVVIMRLNKENDGYVFETIEDDEEFNQIIEYLEDQEGEEIEE